MAKEKTLEDLVHNTLKDITCAERKTPQALPKTKRAAQLADLNHDFTPRPRSF